MGAGVPCFYRPDHPNRSRPMLLVWCALLIPANTSAAMSKAAKTLTITSVSEKGRLANLDFLTKMGPDAAPHLRVICDRLAVPPVLPAAPVLDAVEKIEPKLYKPLREYALAEPLARTEHLAAIEDARGLAAPLAGLLAAHFAAEVERAARAMSGTAAFAVKMVGVFPWIKADEDPAVVAAVKLAAGPKVRNPILRLAAVNFLVDWAGEDAARRKEVVPVLASGLSVPNAELACRCISKAGEWGAAAKDLLPAIKKLKVSAVPEVRDAAAEAAAKIESK